jgi:hypothetical protein
MEILLHGGTKLGGWRAKQIHEAVLAAFNLSDNDMASTSFDTICASSKPTACWKGTASDTPTGSPTRGTKSHCYSCCFTNKSAALWPTASFITSPMRRYARKVNSNLLSTELMLPSAMLFNSYRPLEIVEVFLFTIYQVRV